MSRDVACVSFLGHAEIEGSEPSPGMFSRNCERQRAARVRTTRRGSEVDESRAATGGSEHVSAWFGALPGHCYFTQGASTASDESEMAVPTGRRTRRVCASEASAEQERAPLSPWFGALPGHVLTRPRAPASGPREDCASGLRSRRVARSERCETGPEGASRAGRAAEPRVSERARLGVVRSPPRALLGTFRCPASRLPRPDEPDVTHTHRFNRQCRGRSGRF